MKTIGPTMDKLYAEVHEALAKAAAGAADMRADFAGGEELSTLVDKALDFFEDCVRRGIEDVPFVDVAEELAREEADSDRRAELRV